MAATDPVATDAPTTVASTAPPTTLPQVLDLSTLPGLLAVSAISCAPAPYPPQEVVENPILCTLKPDGTDVKVVSLPGEIPDVFSFTSDFTHLFYSDPYSNFGYFIDLTTGEHHERRRYEPFRSGISPNGELVLGADPVTYVLSIGHVDGSAFPDGRTLLPVTDAAVQSVATWAPDSTRFAYLLPADAANAGIGANDVCFDVWVGTIDGTPPQLITHFGDDPNSDKSCAESVRWSPTDDTLLLRRLGAVAADLYVVDADGGNLTALTHSVPNTDPTVSTYASVGTALGGDWSPDGKYIVFIVGDGTEYQLAVMNADGSQVTPITAAPLGIASSFRAIRWSSG